MQIHELIAHLQLLPQSAQVVIETKPGSYSSFQPDDIAVRDVVVFEFYCDDKNLNSQDDVKRFLKQAVSSQQVKKSQHTTSLVVLSVTTTEEKEVTA